MGKKRKYTQLKAQKNRLLQTTSKHKKSKRKSRISSCPSGVRVTTVSRRRIEANHKTSLLDFLFNISLFSRLGQDSLDDQVAFDLNQERKWGIFGSGYLSLCTIPGVNMASDAVMTGAHCIRYCVDTTCKSIEVFRESFNEGLRRSFRGIEICKEKFKQTSAFMFPSRKIKRKFDEMNDRINELEMQIKKIRTINSQSQCQNCQSGEGNFKTLVNVPHLALPLPLAPPPPPPPPPPPLPLPQQAGFKVQKANIVKPCASTEEATKSLVISLDDIKAIKLRQVPNRKARSNACQEKEADVSRKPLNEISNSDRKIIDLKSNNNMPAPMVTLKDLQKVKLKTVEKEDLAFKSPKNNMVMTLRSSLKKVHVKRSPGGTPLDRIVQDTGAGLTPLMTRALQKKFKLANACSISPDDHSPPFGRKQKLFTGTLSPIGSTPFVSVSPRSIR